MEINKDILIDALEEALDHDDIYTRHDYGCSGTDYEYVELDSIVEDAIINYKRMEREQTINNIIKD